MKIQRRRPGAEGVSTQAARSVQATTISPGEAANVAAAPFMALAAGANAAGNVIDRYQQRQAAADASEALATIQEAQNEAENTLQNEPFQMDDQGRIVEQTGELLKTQRDRMKLLVEEVESNLDSRAQRMFRQAYNSSRATWKDRLEDFSTARGNNVLLARGEARIDEMVKNKDYAGAQGQVQLLFAAGLYDPEKARQAKKTIMVTRDQRIVTDVLKDTDVTAAELQMVVQALDDGRWPQVMQVGDPEMALDSAQMLALQSQALVKLNGLDSAQNEKEEQQQERNYRALLADPPTKEELLKLDVNFVSKSRWDDLWDLRGDIDESGGTISDEGDLAEARQMLVDLNLQLGDTSPAEMYQSFRDRLTSGEWSINGEDKLDLLAEFERFRDDIYSNDEYRAEFNVLAADLGGLTREESVMGATQDRPAETRATARARRDFYQAALTTPGFDPAAWVEANRPTYARMALADKLADFGVMDIGTILAEDGTVDKLVLMEAARDSVRNAVSDEARERQIRRNEQDLRELLRMAGAKL